MNIEVSKIHKYPTYITIIPAIKANDDSPRYHFENSSVTYI